MMRRQGAGDGEGGGRGESSQSLDVARVLPSIGEPVGIVEGGWKG